MAEKAEKEMLGIDERIYNGCYPGAARLRVQIVERERDCKNNVRANSKY
jgi:hypothetical protein